MIWARPDLLALLLLVPVVALLAAWAGQRRRAHLAAIAAVESQVGLVGGGVSRARAAQAALAVVATAALCLAAAGPRFGFDWQQQTVEGVSIVVVLDVSRSMDAQDVSPSRLEVARREIADLVGMLRGDAVGLVVFAAGPYVRIPLTVDYDTFVWALQDSTSDTIRAQGSSLAGAVGAATGLLGKATGSGKAIVVVSDGEGHDPSGELHRAIEDARAAEVRIYALGVGDPSGAPIPMPGGGFKKDSAGNVVVTRLDEAALEQLAASTGGAYVRAVASDSDVHAIYVEEIRGKLDAAERGVRREKLWYERFQWPLAVALLAMAVGSGLGIGRRSASGGRALSAAALLVALTWSHAAEAGPREDGLAAHRTNDWTRAIELLGQARVEAPDDVVVSQALAEALYRVGRYREAEQLFRTLAVSDAENRPIHLYNSGNAAYRGGRLEEAARRFREAAQADPSLAPAQTNATAVEQEIALRRGQARRPPDAGEESDGEQGQGGQGAGQQQDGGGGEEQAAQPGDAQAEGGKADAGSQGDGRPGAQSETGDQPGAAGEGAAGGEAGQQDPGAQGQPGARGLAASEGEAEGSPGDRGSPDGAARPTDDDGGERGASTAADGAEPGEPGPDGPITSIAGDGGEGGADSDEGPASSGGAMTAEQAARLVDAVQDGTPRVVVGGAGTEKDW